MEREIRKATAALVTALARGDAAGAGAVYTDDARLLSPAAELIEGRHDIEAYWRAGIAVGVSALALERLVLDPAGTHAVEIGRYAVVVAEQVADRGKYLALHRRQPDGSWRRAADVFNPDAPAPGRPPHEEDS